uniref:Snf2-related CREBBP activator protein n=1 Tax=Astyanax mexicanus TaxID=7994 RepID=A0A8B9JSA3_ASTMX
MYFPALFQVRQWIAGRATAGSTPCTSRTPSPPPASSSGDWNQLQSDRAAPLCGSHGKQTSSQASGGASQSDQMLSQRPRSDKHADMAELAKHEADIEHRTLALKREGFWSLKRLSRVTEPVRPKVHWDYLCEEMQWLSADFAQERRWKRGVARKVVRMVMRHHEELRQKEERAKREEQAKLRRVAASIAKEVRTFWSSVEKVVQYKQQSRLEEKRKKALDLQLDFIVGQTERYSDLLSQSLHATPTASTSIPLHRDFEPPCEEEDDEETIEVEEQQEGNDAETQRREIELLRQEGTLPLDQLLSTFTLPQVSENSSLAVEDEDKEFSANEEDAEDVEDTIEAQEKVEGDGDHEEELDDLAREGEMSMEELLEKYRGAYEDAKAQETPRPKKEISHIAATAESLQPKGYTLATTKVKTPIPFLLHGNLREYQHIGLDWLVTMYEKKLNGILADEMGLGKTIQTIALLAHLACEKGNWGPHLIIVPTSVMLNWEMELKRWCPGFKILTYYGSQKERKLKRQGWTKPNAFHVCITSYKLVLQDHQAFRRKSWRYLILDEAQNIKNFKSQRWQSLLNFNSHRRLLLTGTPLQNSLMELWSLMHFLMPHVFQSHREFKEWFSNPLTGMIEGSQEYNEGLVKRLHKVLRPFLLRRIKVDVEKQMPKKYEHVVRCRLSKRQRFLYDDFMAQASTRETLASGHFMSVINILMQLRKVCNHPNLFDPRPIHSPFITEPIIFSTASLVTNALEISPFQRCDLSMFDLVGLERRVTRHQADVYLPRRKVTHQLIQEIIESPEPPPRPKPVLCPVTVVSAPRAPVGPSTSSTGAAVRPSAPHPVMAVRPPAPPSTQMVPASPQASTNVMTQRVLLSPDMQARLPSGEVVSIAQLASLAGRPVSSSQGSKPVTFQLQGNKLTLSGAPLHQVPVPQPRPIQGNVMHLVSSGGQHHLISQPAQVAVLHTVSQTGSSSANPSPGNTTQACSGLAVPLTAAQGIGAKTLKQMIKKICIHILTNAPPCRFTFVIPPVEAKPITMHCCHPPPSHSHQQALFSSMLSAHVSPLLHVLHRVQCNMRTHFPDLRLIQYDCGKLQTLHLLLRKLKTGGHRVLIFTQMTRMLDVLEQFLNYHGHIYLRLDGSTRVEQRQALMERFNADRRIFCFILSTRSGGVGVNLTGADTVVFYDSDWNPTMDAQAQDRCHRIGQTRDVHIYRLISERTVEENILKKANQKRMLGDMAIEGGNFTTAFFKQQTIRELFDVTEGEKKETESTVLPSDDEEAVNKQQTNILEQALCRAEDEEDIVAASQAKAEQVAELAEFNENIPLDDGESRDQEEEELSKAEQEIAALVEQLTPIERYAMNFLEASLEDICKEELKQAEEQVEAARKGLDQAKEEGLKLHQSSDNDEEDSMTPTPEEHLTTRRTRKHKEKGAPSTRVSGRLRGTPANMDDVSITHPSPDKERGKKVETLVPEPGGSRSSGSSSSLKSPQPRESQSGTPQQDTIERERGASISSDSICSPEQLLEQDGQHSLTSHPRSPRKRQTADGEVLKGLPEDSPSAKVLRKLPGRLVTVVEEKEPRRRRRGASGSGGIHTEGSSEEVEQVESVQDTTSHSPDQASQLFKEKPLPKSPSTSPPPIQQGQEQVSPSSLSSPGRGYQPYSPTHSPDMPVLRNLPVRRRLETESRMAAQLGEQYVGRGRGIDRRTPLSPKKQESTTSPTVASDPNATNLTPVKRKRGRPRKAAPKPQETTEQGKSVVQGSRSEEQSPPHSPKRKRGRPRKNSTVNIALSGKSGDAEERPTTLHESPSQESLSSLNISSPVSSVEPVNLHSVP